MNLYFHLNFDQYRISRTLTGDFWLEGSFNDGKILELNGDCLMMQKKEKSLLGYISLSFYVFGKLQESVTIKPKSIFSPTLLTGKFGGNNYSIKIHIGYKYSFFENNRQIALLDIMENAELSKPLMKLVCNSDVNKELLVGIVFYSLKIRTNGFDGRELTYNLYSKHKYDRNWKVNK